VWTQNLYWSWIYSHEALINQPATAYPTVYAIRPAGLDKELNTALGSGPSGKRYDPVRQKHPTPRGLGGARPRPRANGLCRAVLPQLTRESPQDARLTHQWA